MRFTATTALLALASSVLAQTSGFDPITKPNKGEVIPAGSTFEIQWQASANWTGPVTIGLLGGPDAGGLQPVSVIVAGVDSSAGQYSWAVNKTLGSDATYGIRIILESDTSIFQYSFPFAISAAAGSSGSGSSTAPPTTSSTGESQSASTTDTTQQTTMTTATAVTTGAGNLSTTAKPSKTVVITTLTNTAASGATGKSGATGSSVPSNPGAVVRASSIALVGGLALAIVAL